MCMGWEQYRSAIKRSALILIIIALAVTLSGCASIKKTDRLDQHYEELETTMKNYLDETTLPAYTGEYVEIKIRKAYRFYFHGDYRYFYDLLIAPIYNSKTSIKGIVVDSEEHPKKYEKFYYDINHSYAKMYPYTFESLEDILCLEYKFCLGNNSVWYNYKFDEGEFESAVSNITVTVNINGIKDKIVIHGIQFEDGTNLYKDEEILRDLDNGRLHAQIYPFVKSN